MKPPTTTEIQRARKVVQQPERKSEAYQAMDAAEDWAGGGWSMADVLYGIMLGLHIAEQRSKQANVGKDD